MAAELRWFSRNNLLVPQQAVLCFLASSARTSRGCAFIEKNMSPESLRRVVLGLTAQQHLTCTPSSRAQLLCNFLLLPSAARAVRADNWSSRLFSAGDTAGLPSSPSPDDDLWDCAQQSARPPTCRPSPDFAPKLRRLLHCYVWSPHFAMSTGGRALLDRLQDIVSGFTQAPGITDTVTGW